MDGLVKRILAALRLNAVLFGIVLIGAILFLGGLALLVGLNPAVATGLLVGVLSVGALLFRWRHGSLDLSERLPVGKAIGSTAAALLVVGLLIQAVPYGRDTANPPVIAERLGTLLAPGNLP